MATKFRLRKQLVFDANQRLVFDATTYKGYLTVISRNMLSGAPVVIGPLDLRRDQWLALSEHCRAVAKLLAGHNYLHVKAAQEIY
jgi:hypothetical protein